MLSLGNMTIVCATVLVFVAIMPSMAFAQDVLADSSDKKPKGIEFRSNTWIIVAITVFDCSAYSMYKWYTANSEYGILHEKFDWKSLLKSGWKSAIGGLVVGCLIWTFAVGESWYDQTSEFVAGSDGFVSAVDLVQVMAFGVVCIYAILKFRTKLDFPQG